MSVYLLDVNVLIALAWSNHVHHAVVTNWFAANGANGWATCPITQAGFVRISSNPTALGAALTPAQAIGALQQLTAHQAHRFWPDDIPVETALNGLNLVGHRQVTDAYLIRLAAHHGGKLATLDRAVIALNPDVVLLT